MHIQVHTVTYAGAKKPWDHTQSNLKNKFGGLIQFLVALNQAKTSMVSPFEGFHNKQITEQKTSTKHVICEFCVDLESIQ